MLDKIDYQKKSNYNSSELKKISNLTAKSKKQTTKQNKAKQGIDQEKKKGMSRKN